MIRAEDFLAAATAHGFDFYSGVPCSFLTPLINGVISAPGLSYVGAASEGEAVAIAAGAWAAGRKPVVMFQNSGLGNAVNPLTSLNAPFRIPTLVITTWRGEPGRPDEPQHEVMGQITHDLLSLMGIEHAALPERMEDLQAAFDAADAVLAQGRCFAFVMRDGSVADEKLTVPPAPAAAWVPPMPAHRGGPVPTRAALLETFLRLAGEDRAVVATTGKTGRELFMLQDRAQHLYLVGSMGGAGGVGLGVALNTTRPVTVLDGDGAALMKLGTLATIGACAPTNLLHILLDNGVHDSTGGQPTVSASVDFAAIAAACGYRHAVSCDSVVAFEELFADLRGAPGPSLIHAKIQPGSLPKLIRPTVKPADVAARFKAFVGAAP